MDTMSLQAEQNDLIRMILDVQDLNVLRRIRKAFTQEEAEASRACVCEEAEPYKSRAEIEADWQEVCHTIKEARKGKVQGRPVEELLNEL